MTWSTPQNARILADIERFGWQSLHIHPSEPGQSSFTYSIGFFRSYGAPEVAIFGLEQGKSHALLSQINTLLARGLTIEFDREDDRILVEPYNVVFKRVRTECLAYYFGTALRFYAEDEIPAAVMLLPDKENRFPWNPEYTGMDQSEALSLI